MSESAQQDNKSAGKVPVTVFTGYLGAGKTTILLDVIKQFPKDKYKAVWLKNEIGDVKVDSLVAEESAIASKEMTNGCLCCVLVGILGNALDELLEMKPDRIFIETSGSAYPAPVAWEVRKNPRLHLDGIVTVIDVVNFPGYVDKSSTAKLQAKYTDLIVLNKTELVNERQLDKVLDDVIELNPDTPRINTTKGHIPADVLIGLDTKLFETMEGVSHDHAHGRDHSHQTTECDLIHIRPGKEKVFDREKFLSFVKSLPPTDVYRAKGVVALTDGCFGLLNFVAGRFTFDDLHAYTEGKTALVLMGDLYSLDAEYFTSKLPPLSEEDIEIVLRP